ncbi:MAG: GntR family transcriptional regulator [Romboutsia sp.]
MEWAIDNNKPIHTQLVDQLKMNIVSGEIPIGSKLDPVRIMAQEAEVNPNTMQKALTELERQELVYSKRTSGRFVTDDIKKIKAIKEELASIKIKELKEILIKLGYNSKEIIAIISENLRSEV